VYTSATVQSESEHILSQPAHLLYIAHTFEHVQS